jgi:hypothetical protein
MSKLHFERCAGIKHNSPVLLGLYDDSELIAILDADELRAGRECARIVIQEHREQLQRQINECNFEIEQLQGAMIKLDTIQWPTPAEIDGLERDALENHILGTLSEPWRAVLLAYLHTQPLEKLHTAIAAGDDIPF